MRERKGEAAIAEKNLPAADHAVVKAVVEIARVVFGCNKMNCVPAVGSVLGVRAVAMTSVEQFATVSPMPSVVIAEEVIGILRNAAMEQVDSVGLGREHHRVAISEIIATPVSFDARCHDFDFRLPGGWIART